MLLSKQNSMSEIEFVNIFHRYCGGQRYDRPSYNDIFVT